MIVLEYTAAIFRTTCTTNLHASNKGLLANLVANGFDGMSVVEYNFIYSVASLQSAVLRQ
jgi:hypothetical protein